MFKIGKKLILTLAIIGAIFGLASCTQGEDVVRVKLEKDNFELIVGEQMELMPIVTKGGIATEANLGFKSYDESVATYVNGKLTAIATGETMVKVYDIDHPLAYATATVVVKAAESLNAKFSYETSMFKGEEQLINCELQLDSKNSIVSYKSANPDVATVDENGKVVAVGTGAALILAKVTSSVDSSESRDYAIEITVIESDYKINYVLDGGVNNEANPAGFNVLELPLVLAEPTKKGYTFLGWYINDEKVDEIAAGTLGDVTVVAKWEKATFYIQYELDGGQNDEANLSEYSTLDLPLTLQPATKTGYKFLGWYNGETQITEITEETLSDYELVAKWEKEVYNLELETNGGEFVKSADLTNAKTLKSFNINYYISYDVNGYNATVMNDATKLRWWNFITLKETEVKGLYEIIQIVAGSTKVTEPYDLVISWHSSLTDATLKSTLNSILNNASAYLGQYVVLNNVPEEKSSECNIEVTVYDKESVAILGEVPTTYTVDDEIKLPQLVKVGYDFLGWFDGETKVEKVEKGTTESVKLVAKFEAIKYTLSTDFAGGTAVREANYENAKTLKSFNINYYISYDVNGYNATVMNDATKLRWWNFITLKETEVKGLYEIIQIVAGSTKVTEPYDLVISWHSSLTDATLKSTLNSILNNASAYLGQYVVLNNVPEEKSSECNIEVTVYDKESVAILGEVPATYTVENEIILPTLTKEGYNFVGWFSGTTKVEKIEKGTTGDLQLVAKFEAIEYTVEFNTDGGSTVENMTFTVEKGLETLPTPTKDGFKFLGWYDGETQVEAIVTGTMGNVTLTAKWEATTLAVKHTVKFELNGGVCGELPTEYEEGTVVTLPTPTRTGYKFLGWFVNEECTGEAVTEISADANTDLTFYAQWEEVVVTPTTELVVDANDSAAYQTINEALAVAEEGYVIKVAAGTYSEELNITVSNITIMGPNAGVKGQDTRTAEAVITGAVTIAANNVVLDGLKFSEDGAIKLGASDNVTITNAYIDATPVKAGGTNRYGSITTIADCSNILVSNTYMNSGTNGSQRSNIAADNVITNLVVENSLLENNVTNASSLCEAIHLYKIAGEIIIKNNVINCTTDNYALYLGTNENKASLIEIKDNEFNGYNNVHTAGLRIQSLGAGAVFNFVHNYVHNMAGNTFNFASSNSDSEINIMYNYFDAKYPYKLSTPGSGKITYKDNFYEVAQTTTTPDYGVIKSLDELDAAYGKPLEWIKINYELNGGTLPEDAPKEFNADRGLQSLPTPTQNAMVFMGWEMNGQVVTEIPAGTTTDVTLVAKWREDAIYVGTSTEDYVLPTLQAALDVAKPGDKIILLPGTYNENVTITIADLTIAGPNQGVNPNKEVRKEEAVYTGNIAVDPTATNLTIDGLAFTGDAKIENNKSADYSGFRFLNNKVYDTTVLNEAWNSDRYQTTGFIEFRLTSSGSTRNFIYKNNLFENVSATNILSNRSINVIVQGNVFKDFGHDAFRTAGGYVYGTLLINDNVFEQTTAEKGNHALFFKALAGPSGTLCTLIIKNNTFKNIGVANSDVPYQGAISSDIFQENPTNITVEGNIFDHCLNYLYLRNNGASTSNWSCNVKNNQFLGLPKTYYFGTYKGSDTISTNPHLGVFGENYYEDNEGNAITDLSKYADMFKHLSTYGTTTSTKPGKAEVENVEFYQISYVLDGGTIRGSYETGYTNSITNDIKLPNAVKTNHDFLGWMLNGEIVTVIPATSRGDIKLVAAWQQQAGELFDVTYNFDGGYSEALLVQNCGNAPTLLLNNFDYNGGTFWGGRYTSDIFISTPSCDPGATFSDRIYIGKNNETGLYEVLSVITSGASSWAAGAEYVITISSSYQGSLGGYWGAINPITAKIKVGQMVAFDKAIDSTSTDNPTNVYFFDEKPEANTLTVQHRYTDKLSGANQLGYRFLGWYDEQGNKWEDLSKLTGAITLTAKWEQLNPVTSIKVDEICEKLLTGDTFQIVASVQPADAYFKQLSYVSSNPDILSVDANGKITAINAGKATITIWDYLKKVKYEKEITVNAITSIDVTFAEEFDGVLAPEETIQLVAKAFGENTTNATFTYASSDTNVLTVSETGLVTAVADGTANVTITMVGTDKTLVLPMVVKTLSQETEVDKLLALLVENNKAVVQAGNISLYNDGVERVYVPTYGSVNRFLFDKFEINTDYYATSEANPNNHKSRREGIDTIQFVTVHDTATLTGTVVSIASNMSSGETSIHYTVGNDAIYGVVPEKYIAYHAGDGTAAQFAWTKTNVKATGNVAPKFEVVEVAGTTYLALNGETTDIVIPQKERNGVKSNATTADLSHLGPVWRVEDGYYYIGGPIWYSSSYDTIGSRGGNNNSIGIEMCSNMSGDIYDTFQRTARLVADILIRNNLDTTRVKMHNTWTGKNCPQTMIAGNFWGEFMEMVELQYEVNTTYKDATITMTSNNPDIIDNTGRVINAPAVTTVVSYNLTVTLGSETRTITLHNVVPGTTTWEQWDGSYSAKTIWNNGNYSIN